MENTPIQQDQQCPHTTVFIQVQSHMIGSLPGLPTILSFPKIPLLPEIMFIIQLVNLTGFMRVFREAAIHKLAVVERLAQV